MRSTAAKQWPQSTDLHRSAVGCSPNSLTGSRVPDPDGRPCRRPRPRSHAPRAAGSPRPPPSGGSTATMPTPRLRVASRSGCDTSPSRCDQLEDRRRLPGRPIDPHLTRAGKDPGQVAGQPAAGDVAQRVHLDGVDQRQAVRGVDPGRLQQLLAEGAAELGDVAVQRPAGAVEEDVPDQRVAVGVQAGGRQGEHHVAGLGPGRGRASGRARPPRWRRRPGRTRRGPAARDARRSRRPSRAQPASTQASAMPRTMAAIRSGTTWPQAM